MKVFFRLLGRALLVVVLLAIALSLYSLLTSEEDNGIAIADGYTLIKESSRSAYIVRESKNADGDPEQEVVVESIVISYSLNEPDQRFLAVKQAAVPESEDTKPDFTSYCYWLIDTVSGDIYGPLADEAAFNAQFSRLSAGEFPEWRGT